MAQLTLAHLAPAGMERPTDATGAAQKMPGTYESGYDSETAAEGVAQWGCDPSRATGRPRHQALEAEVRARPTTAKERLAAQGLTPAGTSPVRQTPRDRGTLGCESKAARGFRRFLLRGLQKIRGAWRLVCLTHNLLKDLASRVRADHGLTQREGTRCAQNGLFQDDDLK